MQKINLPGNEHVSVFHVVEFFIRNIGNRDLNMRASALSFSFFLALFPTVIFFFTLIAYLPIKYDVDDLMFFLSEIVPHDAFYAINDTLVDILKNQRGGLLSIGFISAIILTTNGFHNLIDYLTMFSNEGKSRSFIKQRIIATILAVIIFVLILSSVTFITVVTISLSYLEKIKYFPSKTIPYLISSLNYAVVGIIIMGVIGSIYYIAPKKKNRWKFFSPGAIIATLVSLITTWGFSEYVNHFNSYNKVYGSIGVLIVVMMLIYINTFILLSGFELNVAIDMAKQNQLKKQNQKIENVVVFLPDVKHQLEEKI
ncbi:MAG: YihY/virulence factor BrkB family protein [Bacteroidia bacterium]